MKKILSLSLLLACAVLVTTCKKGKDDPSFTLLTRKARLVGDWQLTKGNVSITYPVNRTSFLTNNMCLMETT